MNKKFIAASTAAIVATSVMVPIGQAKEFQVVYTHDIYLDEDAKRAGVESVAYLLEEFNQQVIELDSPMMENFYVTVKKMTEEFIKNPNLSLFDDKRISELYRNVAINIPNMKNELERTMKSDYINNTWNTIVSALWTEDYEVYEAVIREFSPIFENLNDATRDETFKLAQSYNERFNLNVTYGEMNSSELEYLKDTILYTKERVAKEYNSFQKKIIMKSLRK